MSKLPDLPPALASRYEALGLLGSGACGVVVRAHDRELDREVAIKVLMAQGDSRKARIRFAREAQVAALVRHPHLVSVYDAGEGDGPSEPPFILYEYVPGKTLAARFLTDGPTAPNQALAWARQIAGALGALHESGILHRDIKPANVIVREDNLAFLCDLGLHRRPDSKTVQTTTGVVLGTPLYMAPEQLRGDPSSEATDQFSFGLLIFSMLEARDVVPARSFPELLEWANAGGPLEVRRSGSGLDGFLRKAASRMTSPDPSQRYATMAEVTKALRSSRIPSEEPSGMASVSTGRVASDELAAASTSFRSIPVAGRHRSLGLLLALGFLFAGFWFVRSTTGKVEQGTETPTTASVAPQPLPPTPSVAAVARVVQAWEAFEDFHPGKYTHGIPITHRPEIEAALSRASFSSAWLEILDSTSHYVRSRAREDRPFRNLESAWLKEFLFLRLQHVLRDLQANHRLRLGRRGERLFMGSAQEDAGDPAEVAVLLDAADELVTVFRKEGVRRHPELELAGAGVAVAMKSFRAPEFLPMVESKIGADRGELLEGEATLIHLAWLSQPEISMSLRCGARWRSIARAARQLEANPDRSRPVKTLVEYWKRSLETFARCPDALNDMSPLESLQRETKRVIEALNEDERSRALKRLAFDKQAWRVRGPFPDVPALHRFDARFRETVGHQPSPLPIR